MRTIGIAAKISKIAAAGAVAFGLAAFAGPAGAVTIDFAAIAQNGPLGEGAIGGPNGVYTNPLDLSQGFPVANLQITANAGNSAYMDSFSGGKRGGLGACTTITASGQCSPSNDDNLSLGEEITIALSTGGAFDWSVTEFRDDDHNLIDVSKTLLVGIDGGALVATTVGAQLGLLYESITSITYGYGGGNARNYYIASADLVLSTTSSEVPEPGMLALTGMGLIGLKLAARRRRRTA